MATKVFASEALIGEIKLAGEYWGFFPNGEEVPTLRARTENGLKGQLKRWLGVTFN